MELTLEQALQKGIEAHKAGQVQEADRYYTTILKAQPKHSDANHNMGVLAVGVGKVEEALPFFKTALEANPSTAQFWLSYIDALIKLDRMADAKAVLDQAKSKGAKGDGFDQLEDRLKAFVPTFENGALEEEPPEDQLKPVINLYKQGQYQEAQTQALQLVKHFPNSFNLYNIIGAANNGLGNLEEAIEGYKKALSIKPNYSEAYNNMGIALKGTIFKKPNGALQKTIVSLLDTGRYVRPSEIFTAAISLLKLEPTLQKHLQLGDDEIMRNPLGIISDLSEFSLLCKLMNVCPLPDLELERLLTKLRCSILLNISSLKEVSPKLLGFQSALALQCFTNEYIYKHTEEEEQNLQALEKIVKKIFKNNQQPSPQTVLALASYKALNQYKWYTTLAITDEIKEVFIRQVEEPNEEEKLKQDLPILKEITDGVSSKVRAQYEESPYPRWVNLQLPLKPMSISKVVDTIKLKLHNNKITEIAKPEILIAGCGTGQHSIGTAARFKSSKVLAIDLSLSSLAYAKRKTEELGIENIYHMQADILDLRQLNKQFDIIESAGVLHHMDRPLAGWQVLSDCLKPGGLMRIGLYSELARKDIVKIRGEIRQKGIGSSKTQMKSFRDTVIKSEKDHHKLIIYSPDFYSLSTLRDLLFHIQEHRFTIPILQEHLVKLGLTFCGFEAPEIVSNFKQTNKAKDDLYDLDKWQAYEEANPQTFAGMYHFWCQKAN